MAELFPLGRCARMDFVALFWFLVAASIVGLVWILVSPARLALGFVFLSSLAALAWAGLWNWLLRDGLGPDSVTSTGFEALRRFGSEMLFPGSVCGLIIAVATTRYFMRHRRPHDVAQPRLAERVKAMIPGYEKMFSERGGITPSDPLQFHLYHLARYWSRLVGLCRQDPSKPAAFIETDLGACVQVGSEFAHKLIGSDAPIYERWQDYWMQTQAVLHKRPVTIEAVESASRAFDACLVDLRYDPWANKGPAATGA